MLNPFRNRPPTSLGTPFGSIALIARKCRCSKTHVLRVGRGQAIDAAVLEAINVERARLREKQERAQKKAAGRAA